MHEKETSIKFNGSFDSSEARTLQNAFFKALALETKLPAAVIQMEGMSGKKYRYFINTLVEMTEAAAYLEVGSWSGSTACSAMFGNDVTVFCIDDWSQYDGPRDVFLSNIEVMKTTSNKIKFQFLESDFRKVDYGQIGKYNIYLFDGPHTEIDQYDGIKLAKPALHQTFTLIIDDWNWGRVRAGTVNALHQNNIEVICSIEVRTTQDESHGMPERQHSEWHNGYFLGLCRQR